MVKVGLLVALMFEQVFITAKTDFRVGDVVAISMIVRITNVGIR